MQRCERAGLFSIRATLFTDELGMKKKKVVRNVKTSGQANVEERNAKTDAQQGQSSMAHNTELGRGGEGQKQKIKIKHVQRLPS